MLVSVRWSFGDEEETNHLEDALWIPEMAANFKSSSGLTELNVKIYFDLREQSGQSRR